MAIPWGPSSQHPIYSIVITMGLSTPCAFFLSAPPIGVPGTLGALFKWMPQRVAGALANIPFSLSLKSLIDLHGLSQNPRVYEHYISDELNQITLPSKLLLQMISHSKQVFSRPLRPKCPAFCAIGSGDRIVNLEAAKHYFTALEKGFDFKIFEGAYHEMHNEIDEFRGPYFDYLKKSLNPPQSILASVHS